MKLKSESNKFSQIEHIRKIEKTFNFLLNERIQLACTPFNSL